MQPDYDFDRKTHHSYKGATTTPDTTNFVRGKCKLLGKTKKFMAIQNMKNHALKILLGACLDMQLSTGVFKSYLQ